MSGFLGKSIQVVRDLSVDEQVYLYEKSRLLKQQLQSRGNVESFRINDPEVAVYLLFLEDSTRTKESFRNAAKFHAVRVNDFSAQGSSLKKKESITDTVRMLVGYSSRSVFVVRSSLEGVCRWLERVIGEYTDKLGLPRAVFINAGDGRHEHPTQEFLDEFSFLEQRNWDRSYLHIALVGDLFHGRTVHSKVDGMRVFREVRVDLIAPPELAMPVHYVDQMRENGYEVRLFPSIRAYVDAGDIASTWYFTRLQLERMGDQLLEKADSLRDAVTFRPEYVSRMSSECRFFHPLPRHSVTPTIPAFLDRTFLNGWDEQSMNGYFTRIVQIGMLGGSIGDDFEGQSAVPQEYPDDFVEEAPIRTGPKPDYKIGIKPVDSGMVIDHIGTGKSVEQIWDHIFKIRRILGLHVVGSQGVFVSEQSGEHKGLISLPSVPEFDERMVKMLGAIAPGCTLNIIDDAKVVRKYRLHMPRRVYDFEEISCKNEACVSHPTHYEHVIPEFLRSGATTFVCKYCEKPHDFQEIW